MEHLSVRAGTAEDAQAIQTVAREAWHAAYETVLGVDTVEETVDSWYDPERLIADDIEPPERPLFVATIEETVVGFVEAVPNSTDEDLAHLYRIYVAPDHWGNGIGSALLARIETELDDRGFDRLELSVLAENDIGVSFYEEKGFRRTATSYNDQLEVEEYEYRKPL